jgi:hypothetical protein
VVESLSKSVRVNSAKAVVQELASVTDKSFHSHAFFWYSVIICVIFSFFSSVSFSLSKRHFFTTHSSHHVIHINLQIKSIILYKKLLFSGALVISHKISTQNIFVAEFNESIQSNKPFAVC